MKRFASLLQIRFLERPLYIYAVIYAFASVLLKWQLSIPPIHVGLYVLGGFVGLHIFDWVDQVSQSEANVVSSMLNSIVVHLAVILVTFFVLTSTNSFFGSGLVLFLNLRILFLLRSNRMHTDTSVVVNINSERYLQIMVVVFIIETLLFILI